MLSWGFFWALWLTVDVNDNQPRGLLLCCSDLISFCYQGIGIILFCSRCSQLMLSMRKSKCLCAKVRRSHLWSMSLTTGRDSSHDPAILTAERSLTHAPTQTHPRSHPRCIHTNAYTHTHTHTHSYYSFRSTLSCSGCASSARTEIYTLHRICSTFVILYSSKAHLVR